MPNSILTADQKRVLALLASETSVTRMFYLGGGTALAEYYLHHRLSEDLDFFSETEVDVEGISVLLKKMSAAGSIQEVSYQQSFNRNLFFLRLPSGEIKTEFTYYPFPRIQKGLNIGELEIDSLLDIAVNKIFTISQKPRSRDFIDLYCILREKPQWNIDDLVLQAKSKFDHHIDPLQLAGQFVKAETLKDYPTLKIELPPKIWIDFFLNDSARLAKSQLRE